MKLESAQYPSIPPERRQLMLMCVGDGSAFRVTTHLLHLIDVHMPEKYKNEALSWLVRNRVTGRRLAEFYQDECAGSPLTFHQELLSKVKKKEKHPVIYGKDFV